MASTRPSIRKRQNEMAKLDRREAKAQRAAERKSQKDSADPLPEGVDPDIAGIVPGPQPVREDW